MKSIFLVLALVAFNAFSVPPDQKTLPIGLAPQEKGVILRDAPMTDPPVGHVRSLGEWEASDSAITLWTNPSYVKALGARGKVVLLGDSASEVSWWKSWLHTQGIPAANFSFLAVQTDSIWIRDYGPWYILDGEGHAGMVDTKYNRPRPNDDLVPGFLARTLGIPMFQPGLVHTGGNYYSDGHGDAFSSTLVYRENSGITKQEVNRRMQSYLGIDRYTTSRLAPGITIEHMDTFGKLVSPDTWVFSDFPSGSRFRADSEAMVALLKTLKSPYGTPYKIHRLKMTPISGTTGENYRAYINAFISNHALYYPTYGGEADSTAKQVFQTALPGYDIVGVDGAGTEWGDSVHCRSNNLYSTRTLFLFPKLAEAQADKPTEVVVEAYPAPGAQLDGTPKIHWSVNGQAQPDIDMFWLDGREYRAQLPALARASRVELYVSAKDTGGHAKTAPLYAPEMKISIEVP